MPRFLLTALMLAAVIWLTLFRIPHPEGIRFWQHTDKVVHAVMFGALYTVAALDYHRWRRPWKAGGASAVAIAALTALLGAVIEMVQPYVHRSCDIWDFLADAAGIILAFLWLYPYRYSRG